MYSNILVPVDLDHGDVGARIIKLASRIGGAGASVTVLTVMDAIPGYVETQIPADLIEQKRADVREKLTELAHKIDSNAKVAVRRGVPAAIILDEAGQIGADAIVLGSHRPGLRDYFIGSTAARVVRHAMCSVVVDRAAV